MEKTPIYEIKINIDLQKVINYLLSDTLYHTKDGTPYIEINDARKIIGRVFHLTKKEIKLILDTLQGMGLIRYNNKRVYILISGEIWNGSISLQL